MIIVPLAFQASIQNKTRCSQPISMNFFPEYFLLLLKLYEILKFQIRSDLVHRHLSLPRVSLAGSAKEVYLGEHLVRRILVTIQGTENLTNFENLGTRLCN